jgi:hypothetical protein
MRLKKPHDNLIVSLGMLYHKDIHKKLKKILRSVFELGCLFLKSKGP